MADQERLFHFRHHFGFGGYWGQSTLNCNNPPAESILLDDAHPFYYVQKAIELGKQGYTSLFQSTLIEELQSMGREVVAYYIALVGYIDHIESYTATPRSIGDCYLVDIKCSSKRVRFILEKEQDEYRIEDILVME